MQTDEDGVDMVQWNPESAPVLQLLARLVATGLIRGGAPPDAQHA